MARSLLQLDAVFTIRETDLPLALEKDPDVVYHLRPITLEKGRAISQSHTSAEFNRNTHRKEFRTDEGALFAALLDYCLVKWEGVKNGADPAPCDLPHKLLLPAEVQAALVTRAQEGQVTAAEREASFRQSAGVL